MSGAVIAASSAASAAASAAASRAADSACRTFLAGYRHDADDVRAMRTYAECVGRLYPEPTAEDQIFVAALFAFATAGLAIGGLFGGPGVVERLLYAILGAVCGVLFGVVGWLVIAGVRFVLQ